MSGFAMRRAFGRGQVIGPVIAETEADAGHLVASLLEGMENRFVRLDTRQPEGLLRTLTRGGALAPVEAGRPGVYGLAAHALS